MKTLLLSIFALAVTAAPVLSEDQDQPKPPKKNPPPQRQVNPPPRTVAPRIQNVAPRIQNNTSANPQFQPRYNPTVTNRSYTPKTYTPNFQPRTRTTPRFTPPDPDAPQTNTTTKSDASLANQNWRS